MTRQPSPLGRRNQPLSPKDEKLCAHLVSIMDRHLRSRAKSLSRTKQIPSGPVSRSQPSLIPPCADSIVTTFSAARDSSVHLGFAMFAKNVSPDLHHQEQYHRVMESFITIGEFFPFDLDNFFPRSARWHSPTVNSAQNDPQASKSILQRARSTCPCTSRQPALYPAASSGAQDRNRLNIQTAIDAERIRDCGHFYPATIRLAVRASPHRLTAKSTKWR